MKGIHIFLADGFEDMEALATRDVLLRGGVPVMTVSITDEYLVESSHGLQVTADTSWNDLEVMEPGTDGTDVMIFPGGMPGSKSLASCKKLIQAMKAHYKAGGTLAAICAAPGLVLRQLDDVKGLEFTCFDGFEQPLVDKGAVFTPRPAVRSGRIITGRSAGHAVAFALKIVEALVPDRLEEVRHSLFLETE